MLSYNYWMREERISGPEQVSVRARRHRDCVSLHGALRHGDHDDRQPGVLHSRRRHHERAGRAENGGDARAAFSARSGAWRTRWDSGLPCSRRFSACGRACRICMPTSTASSRRCRRRSASESRRSPARPIVLRWCSSRCVRWPSRLPASPSRSSSSIRSSAACSSRFSPRRCCT